MFLSVILYFVEVVPFKEGDKSQHCDVQGPEGGNQHHLVTPSPPRAHDCNMRACFQTHCKKKSSSLATILTMLFKICLLYSFFFNAETATCKICHIVQTPNNYSGNPRGLILVVTSVSGFGHLLIVGPTILEIVIANG